MRYNNKQEVRAMEKTTTLNLRVNPVVKQRAEDVLAKLGIPMSTAIDMYLNQISLTGGIPLRVALPYAPTSVNMDLMTEQELRGKLAQGMEEAAAGRIREAGPAMAELREKLEDLNDSFHYGTVLRAKGIVAAQDGRWLHYDYVPEEHEVRYGAADYTGRICVIGSGLKEDKLKELFRL